MRRDNKFLVMFFAAILVVILFVSVQHTSAQDGIPTPDPIPTDDPFPPEGEQHVMTLFSPTCIEALGETHYRIHFGYYSDGVETFTFSMGDIVGNDPAHPYDGQAFTNVPATFTTEPGVHNDWYLDAHSEDSPYTFHLIFTDDVGYADLPLATWDFPFPDGWCNGGAYTPQEPGSTPEPTANFMPQQTEEPTAEPTEQPASAMIVIAPENRTYWSYVRSGSGQYYWSRVSLTGVILDLPPATNQS